MRQLQDQQGLFTVRKIPLARCWVLNIAHETGQIFSYVQTRKTLVGWKEKRRVFFSRPSYYLRLLHR